MATPKLEVEIGAKIDALTKGIKEGKKSVMDFDATVTKSASGVTATISSEGETIYNFTNGVAQSLQKLSRTEDDTNRRAIAGIKAKKKAYEDSGKKISKSLEDTSRSANGVAVELSRIVQDAPYGMQGIANNIQSLTQHFANAQRQAGSFGATLKQSLSALITPANLMVISISAITAGITAYQMWQQKAAKETKGTESALLAAKKATDEYLQSLDAVTRSQLVGVRNSSEEITTLKLLYGQTQNNTLSLKQRKDAADQLQKLYPDIFKNLSDEEILSGKAADSYNRLTSSIIATGKARAALDIITENSKKQFENEQKVNDLIIQQRKAMVDLEKQRAISNANAQMGTGGVFDANQLYKAQSALDDINNEINTILKSNDDLKGDSLKLETQINQQIANGARLTAKVGQELDKVNKKSKDIKDVIEDALRASGNSSDMSGLLGNDVDVERVRQRYAKLYADIDKYVADQAKKGIDVSAKASEAKIRLSINEANEQANISISEQKRVADEIQRIQAQSGVKISETKAKELAQLQKWYDEEINKAQGNADILLAIEEVRKAQEVAINEKYEKKKADISLQYTRRLYETQSQILTRQLNDRYKKLSDQAEKEVKNQADALTKQKQLQEQYWQQLDAIRKIEQLEQLSISLGDAVGNAFQRMLSDGTNVFQALLSEFKSMIIKMVAQTAAIKVTNWIGGLLGLGSVLTGGGGIGSLLGGLIGGGNTMSMSKALPSSAPSSSINKLAASKSSIDVNVSGAIKNNVISLSNKRGLSNNLGGR